MNQRLIFIGGAPAIGKSTTCALLYRRLPDSILLDADDLWCKMHPFRVDESTISMTEDNIGCVLRNFLKTGFSNVILCWVLHKQTVIDRILERLADLPLEFYSFTLVCDEGTLRSRWESRPTTDSAIQHSLQRLSQTRELTKSVLIDTTNLSPEEVVDLVEGRLSDQSSG